MRAGRHLARVLNHDPAFGDVVLGRFRCWRAFLTPGIRPVSSRMRVRGSEGIHCLTTSGLAELDSLAEDWRALLVFSRIRAGED